MMVLKNARICWNCKARELGFEDPFDMFHFMYLAEEMSTYKMAEIFGCSWYTVAKWLKYYGIPLRKPGGPINKGKKFKKNPYKESAYLR